MLNFTAPSDYLHRTNVVQTPASFFFVYFKRWALFFLFNLIDFSLLIMDHFIFFWLVSLTDLALCVGVWLLTNGDSWLLTKYDMTIESKLFTSLQLNTGKCSFIPSQLALPIALKNIRTSKDKIIIKMSNNIITVYISAYTIHTRILLI